MIKDFIDIHELLVNKDIKTPNEILDKYIQNYLFLYITEDNLNHQEFYQKIKESNVLIMNYFDKLNKMPCNLHFILSFKKTIIIINHQLKSFIKNLISQNTELEIYFLKNTKCIFDQNIKIQYKEAKHNSFFNDEISSFNQHLSLKTESANIKKIWNTIRSSISAYLIKESYSKLNNNRLTRNHQNTNEEFHENVEDDKFIELRTIESGSSSLIKLIYMIEDENLYIIKKVKNIDLIGSKLMKRETDNYLKINHPYIPKIYGTTKEENYLIIEYINGINLSNIKYLHLSRIDKYSIILQIITVIKYLHEKHFIYRDLKPNNIMIDQSKNIILIDFDQMITYNSKEEQTKDFTSVYIAPEIDENNLRQSADIYSIGQMIYFIMNEKDPSRNVLIDIKDFNNHPEMKIFYLKCIIEIPEKRPTIKELIVNFYNFIISNNIVLSHIIPDIQYELAKFSFKRNNQKAIIYFSLASEQNNANAQYDLGTLYLEGEYIAQDINKAIYYFTQASKKNHPNALFNLGLIYMDDKFVPRDIQKAIHYFKLASELNHVKAQINLGTIYYEDKYSQRDINKAIYYYLLASDNNDPRAQYNLGIIFYYGEYIERDINKAIHYFTLASNDNYSDSSFFLGVIFYEGKYIPKDINKATHYFSLASNQNNSKAQFYLGIIYMNDNDINKAIHYFTLSANQNNAESQVNLGKIFYDGKYIERNIEKAIYYFSLASNNNFLEAHLNLSQIFSEGKYIQRDINKTIHYLTLASNLNDTESLFNLGLIYYNNQYIQQDISRSIYYFTLAASQHHSKALFYLGQIYLKNEYFDINKSIDCFKLSSDQNDIDSQLMLGLIYYEGKYLERDINKSIHNFTLASDQNCSEAIFNLGLIYHKGKYVNVDINKAIHFYSLAAKQKFVYALNNLGIIYSEGQYVPCDINRAICYFQQASDLNYSSAQFNLGLIYYEGKLVKRDMKRAIHYFMLASNQKDSKSQYHLGLIYLEGKFVKQDISKAINYFTLSSYQNNSLAQLKLGVIYYEGKYIKQDINKAIHYLTIAANHNQRNAQYNLGLIYYKGTLIKQDIQKSLFWFIQSAENEFNDANFAIGYFYHEGKNVIQDINKAIHFYKEASSFNNQYAKNNLGIIFKNGFGDKIQKNLKMSKIYFKEAIRLKEDSISLYNLSHIYIYEKSNDKSLNKSINLLIKSIKLNFEPSKILLCLALIKKFDSNTENIKSELEKHKELSIDYLNEVIEIIKEMIFQTNYEKIYQQFQEIDFLYNPLLQHLTFKSLFLQSTTLKIESICNKSMINSEFYEGFGLDI